MTTISPNPAAFARTVKVRVAVAVDENGWWMAVGCQSYSDGDAMGDAMQGVEGATLAYWLIAELPIPSPQEVVAQVEERP